MCRIVMVHSTCLLFGLRMERSLVVCHNSRVLLGHLASLETRCVLVAYRTWVPHSPTAGSNHSEAAEPCTGFDPGSAVCLGRIVSSQYHYNYLTAMGVAGSIGHLVLVFADCGLGLWRSLAVRKKRTILHQLGSLVLVRMASVGIGWMTIAANDMQVLPARDELTMVAAHTVCFLLGKETVSWNRPG